MGCESIHRGIEKSGIGQGGSPDFLAGASGPCQRQGAKRGRKIRGKADAGQNRFFSHDVYNRSIIPAPFEGEFALLLGCLALEDEGEASFELDGDADIGAGILGALTE